MKLFKRNIVLVTLFVMVYSQSPEGTWNGTLDVQGTKLRVVFHVTKTDSQYKATMDSPDQYMSGMPVTITTFNYPNIKFEIPTIRMVYEGVLSDTLITGRWMQAGQTFSLVLSKAKSEPGTIKN